MWVFILIQLFGKWFTNGLFKKLNNPIKVYDYDLSYTASLNSAFVTGSIHSN